MEAYAILGLHAACKRIDPGHALDSANACDSTAAINTYRKLLHLNLMQLPNLSNADVWRIIRKYRLQWGNIQMYHTPSHMDGYLEAEDLDTASIYNTMAEKLADEYYHLDQSTVDNADLTQYLFGSFYHDNFPITVPFRKWAHQQVTITRSRRHYTTNHPLALRDIEIDWACIKSVAKQHRCLATKAINENHMGAMRLSES